MNASEQIGSPLIDPVLHRAAECAKDGISIVVVGAKGCGISSFATMLLKELRRGDSVPVILDCAAPGTWQEKFRAVCDSIATLSSSEVKRFVLLVDHAEALSAEEIYALRKTTREWRVPEHRTRELDHGSIPNAMRTIRALFLKATRKINSNSFESNHNKSVGFSSQIWLGNLDCRGLEDAGYQALASEPRFVFQLPEYNPEHLLTLYSAIGHRQDSDWGEAILHTILDWCGTDLALAERLGAQFYGTWRDNLYNQTVEDILNRWLISDDLVEEYRQALRSLDEHGQALVALLNTGGKVASHAPFCNQEPNASIRRLVLLGFVSPNLLPGFYQYRNLTIRLLALQTDAAMPPLESTDLVRKYSNKRIGEVLQDTELSLRLLALRCFTRLGTAAIRNKLMATRTDEQAIPADLRKSLLTWARETSQSQLHQSLIQRMKKYEDDFFQNTIYGLEYASCMLRKEAITLLSLKNHRSQKLCHS